MDLELEKQILQPFTGEINYPHLHSVLNANSMEDKYFKGAKYIRNFRSRGSKINYSGNPNILTYLNWGN